MGMHFAIGELFPVEWHCYNCWGANEESRRGKQRWCRSCAAEYKRKNAKKYRELSAEEKKKSNARAYANTYQRRGWLVPKPCELCGVTEGIEKHHPDYDEPLKVNWLCRPCHENHHHGTAGKLKDPENPRFHVKHPQP